MMDITIDKVDCLRERAGLSYEEAVDYLKQADGDLVQALVLIEREAREGRQKLMAKGTEVLTRLKDLIRAGNETKIRIKQNDRTVAEVPVTAGIVGAVLAPQVAVLGALTALATRCSIAIEGRASSAEYAPGEAGGQVHQVDLH